jgi:hypothetical protein
MSDTNATEELQNSANPNLQHAQKNFNEASHVKTHLKSKDISQYFIIEASEKTKPQSFTPNQQKAIQQQQQQQVIDLDSESIERPTKKLKLSPHSASGNSFPPHLISSHLTSPHHTRSISLNFEVFYSLNVTLFRNNSRSSKYTNKKKAKNI